MKKLFLLGIWLLYPVMSYGEASRVLSLLNVPKRAMAVSITHGPIARDSDECTYFDKLAKRYAEAQLAEKADVAGWRSGRCYFSGTRNEPNNNLLTGIAKDGGEHGPIFPGEGEFKIMSIEKLIGGGPDYFDTMDQFKKMEVQQVIDDVYVNISPVQVVEQSLASRYEKGNLEFRIRKSGEFLFGKVLLLRDEVLKGTAYKSGDAYAYCYYFKKVN